MLWGGCSRGWVQFDLSLDGGEPFAYSEIILRIGPARLSPEMRCGFPLERYQISSEVLHMDLPKCLLRVVAEIC